jgi:hypothetical protein
MSEGWNIEVEVPGIDEATRPIYDRYVVWIADQAEALTKLETDFGPFDLQVKILQSLSESQLQNLGVETGKIKIVEGRIP